MINNIVQMIETSENGVDNILVPVLTVIITWFLSRLKSPDYGKMDWKCKRKKGAFEYYTIHIAVTFLAPIFVSAINGLIWEYELQDIVSRVGNKNIVQNSYELFIAVSYSIVYGIITWIITCLEVIFIPNKITDKWYIKKYFLLYAPILYNYIMGIILNAKNHIIDLPWFHSLMLFILQMIALFFFDDGKLFNYNKITIETKDGEIINADVKNVHKKGKWLRIVNKLEFKEKLILFDDVKSIEYHK